MHILLRQPRELGVDKRAEQVLTEGREVKVSKLFKTLREMEGTCSEDEGFEGDRQTDMQTDRQTCRQTDRQTCRQADRQTDLCHPGKRELSQCLQGIDKMRLDLWWKR